MEGLTYSAINALFIGGLSAIMLISKRADLGWFVTKAKLITLFIIVAMTAIFDNAIIGSGIVAYNENLTLGLNIFLAPIEDFAYCIVAVYLAAFLWDYRRV